MLTIRIVIVEIRIYHVLCGKFGMIALWITSTAQKEFAGFALFQLHRTFADGAFHLSAHISAEGVISPIGIPYRFRLSLIDGAVHLQKTIQRLCEVLPFESDDQSETRWDCFSFRDETRTGMGHAVPHNALVDHRDRVCDV